MKQKFNNVLALKRSEYFADIAQKWQICRKNKSNFHELLEKFAFEQRKWKWRIEIIAVTKQYNNTINWTTKATPIQGSSKKTEEYVYINFLDKTKKLKPKFKIVDLARKAVKSDFFFVEVTQQSGAMK